MKIWNYSIVLVSICALLLSTSIVSAETEAIDDPENDVYNIDTTKPLMEQMTENIGNQPNVDITEVSCVIADGTLTLTIEVASDGTIQTDEEYSYNLQARTSDGGMYSLMIAYGDAGGMGIGPSTPVDSLAPEPQISGNTFSMQWAFEGDATVEELAGSASYSPVETNIYRDIAPDTETGQDVGNDDDDDTTGDDDDDDTADDDDDDADSGDSDKKGTPGFEIIAVIAAVGIALIVLKRRK